MIIALQYCVGFCHTTAQISHNYTHTPPSFQPPSQLSSFVFRCLTWLSLSLQAEKVHELNEEIGKLLAKAEQLGAEGNVDESQKILMEVEKVRAKKKEAEVGEENVLKREET